MCATELGLPSERHDTLAAADGAVATRSEIVCRDANNRFVCLTADTLAAQVGQSVHSGKTLPAEYRALDELHRPGHGLRLFCDWDCTKTPDHPFATGTASCAPSLRALVGEMLRATQELGRAVLGDESALGALHPMHETGRGYADRGERCEIVCAPDALRVEDVSATAAVFGCLGEERADKWSAHVLVGSVVTPTDPAIVRLMMLVAISALLVDTGCRDPLALLTVASVDLNPYTRRPHLRVPMTCKSTGGRDHGVLRPVFVLGSDDVSCGTTDDAALSSEDLQTASRLCTLNVSDGLLFRGELRSLPRGYLQKCQGILAAALNATRTPAVMGLLRGLSERDSVKLRTTFATIDVELETVHQALGARRHAQLQERLMRFPRWEPPRDRPSPLSALVTTGVAQRVACIVFEALLCAPERWSYHSVYPGGAAQSEAQVATRCVSQITRWLVGRTVTVLAARVASVRSGDVVLRSGSFDLDIFLDLATTECVRRSHKSAAVKLRFAVRVESEDSASVVAEFMCWHSSCGARRWARSPEAVGVAVVRELFKLRAVAVTAPVLCLAPTLSVYLPMAGVAGDPGTIDSAQFRRHAESLVAFDQLVQDLAPLLRACASVVVISSLECEGGGEWTARYSSHDASRCVALRVRAPVEGRWTEDELQLFRAWADSLSGPEDPGVLLLGHSAGERSPCVLAYTFLARPARLAEFRQEAGLSVELPLERVRTSAELVRLHLAISAVRPYSTGRLRAEGASHERCYDCVGVDRGVDHEMWRLIYGDAYAEALELDGALSVVTAPSVPAETTDLGGGSFRLGGNLWADQRATCTNSIRFTDHERREHSDLARSALAPAGLPELLAEWRSRVRPLVHENRLEIATLPLVAAANPVGTLLRGAGGHDRRDTLVVQLGVHGAAPVTREGIDPLTIVQYPRFSADGSPAGDGLWTSKSGAFKEHLEQVAAVREARPYGLVVLESAELLSTLDAATQLRLLQTCGLVGPQTRLLVGLVAHRSPGWTQLGAPWLALAQEWGAEAILRRVGDETTGYPADLALCQLRSHLVAEGRARVPRTNITVVLGGGNPDSSAPPTSKRPRLESNAPKVELTAIRPRCDAPCASQPHGSPLVETCDSPTTRLVADHVVVHCSASVSVHDVWRVLVAMQRGAGNNSQRARELQLVRLAQPRPTLPGRQTALQLGPRPLAVAATAPLGPAPRIGWRNHSFGC